MATADISIFQGLLQPPKTVADYDAQYAQLQGAQLQNRGAELQNQVAQRGIDQDNQLQALMRGMPQGATDLDRLAALKGAGRFDIADKLSTAMDNRMKTQAQAVKDQADAAGTNFKTQEGKRTSRIQTILQFNTPEDVLSHLNDAVKAGELSKTDFDSVAHDLPTDPNKMAAWQLSKLRTALLTPEQQMKLTTPDANATLQAQTQMGTNEATNNTRLKVVGIQQAGENARSSAARQAQYRIAGIDPQTGNFVGGEGGGGMAGMAGMVDALGSYKLDPNTAFARMQPGMKASVISQVQAKYPDYDPTTYSAKRKAAGDFTSGAQGNSLRAFAVGLDHLDQLGKLSDALDNGNIQLVNKIGNAVAQQTGNPAPTNFDTAKAIVSKEVAKALVGGQTGQAERQEMEHLISSANSPKQLKGAMQTVTALMRAQHDALMTQRRAAGLPDSTLPNYIGHDGGGSDLQRQADAILRGGK